MIPNKLLSAREVAELLDFKGDLLPFPVVTAYLPRRGVGRILEVVSDPSAKRAVLRIYFKSLYFITLAGRRGSADGRVRLTDGLNRYLKPHPAQGIVRRAYVVGKAAHQAPPFEDGQRLAQFGLFDAGFGRELRQGDVAARGAETPTEPVEAQKDDRLVRGEGREDVVEEMVGDAQKPVRAAKGFGWWRGSWWRGCGVYGGDGFALRRGRRGGLRRRRRCLSPQVCAVEVGQPILNQVRGFNARARHHGTSPYQSKRG